MQVTRSLAAIAALAGCLWFFPSPPPRTPPAGPNVVLILADDLGYGDLGCYGSTEIPTPRIDALAGEGVRFTDAYAASSVCSPSRAALLTGRYPQRYGLEFTIFGNEERGLDPAETTLAEVFRGAGYRTGMVGKWHLGTGSKYHPQENGFDEFYGFLPGTHSYSSSDAQEPDWAALQRGTQPVEESGYLTDAIGREAVDFVRRHAAIRFFLCASFNAVHIPIDAPESYTARFAHVEDEKRRAYCGMVSALDDAVGRILDALVEVGVDQRTVVVFTNDNGGALYTGVQSNDPLRLGKMYLFEGGIRVPLIVRWRDVTATGEVCEATVSALDLFPTLTAGAGLAEAVERELDGVDLAACLRGDGGAPERQLFWRNGPNHAVRAGYWKLVAAGEHTWLFDLRNDPSETTNLATRYPDVTGELKLAFERWQAQMEAPRWPGHFLGDRQVDGVPYALLP